jgi:hypothetical protein
MYWKEVTAAEFGKMFATVFRDEQGTANVRGFWDVIKGCAHLPQVRVSQDQKYVIIHQESAIYDDFMIEVGSYPRISPRFYLHNYGFWA